MVEVPDCPGLLAVATVALSVKVPAGGVTLVIATVTNVLAGAKVEPVTGV